VNQQWEMLLGTTLASTCRDNKDKSEDEVAVDIQKTILVSEILVKHGRWR
jgi:hypothetical protein